MDKQPDAAEPVKKPRGRWFRLSPDRFVIGLLLAIGLLWLSERCQWFGFNHHKGWTVLIAVAAVGAAAIVVLLWWIAGLILGWRFQFGIRSLLLYCLAWSVAVGWFAVEWKNARRQADTVEAIVNWGGSANYDWRVGANGGVIMHPEPPAPEWLRAMFGDDFFSAVAATTANAPHDAANLELERIGGLTQLKWLDFTDSHFTDAMLQRLEGLTQLEWLKLNGTQVTGTGFVHLAGMTHLKWLYLNYTQITDAGLASLKGHIGLQGLALDNTDVTDAGVKQLEGLTELQQLDLERTKVTDAGMQAFSRLKNLRHLGLSNNSVTDAGLEKLKSVISLRELYLISDTGVTDAGLTHLEGLTQLRQLWLNGTGATDAGVKKLHKALPDCKINR